MPRSKTGSGYVGRRAVAQKRSRRRVSKTADFLAVTPERITQQATVDDKTGEIVFSDRKTQGQFRAMLKDSLHKASKQLKKSMQFMRRELIDDPEGFIRRAAHSIGYAIVGAVRGFSSFSRYLLMPLSVILVLGSMITLSAYTVGLEVKLDGETVGYVMDAASFDAARLAVEERYSQRLGESFQMEQTPVYSVSLVSRRDLVSTEQLEESIAAICEDAAGKTYGVFVDGTLIGTYSNENAIYEMLDAIKLPYQTGVAGETVVFMNDVQIIQDMYADQFEMSIAELRARLLCGDTAHEYIMEDGDSVERICATFGLGERTLYLLNPGVNLAEAPAGTVITVGGGDPVVSVQVSKTVTYEQEIPYDVQVSTTSSLWAGSKQVLSAGQVGITQYTAQIVVVDGVEVSRNIINQTVKREPVTQYELLGTKPISTTGTFIWPIAGTYVITSPFGDWRGDHYHEGVDIAANYNTSILAIDAGVVTVAGWSGGGHGYNVEIDHGNGIISRYSHCNGVDVRVGQTVYQGQRIAGVGSTGNSSGNHCHLTLNINGTYVDPMRYLK